MIQTQEIINAIAAGKVCLVSRYIHDDREHVELVETFDNEAQGRQYLADHGETEFCNMYSSHRLEGDIFGHGLLPFNFAAPEQSLMELELKGIWR